MAFWTQVGQNIDGEAANDKNGYSVSLSADGTTVAIGAPYNNGDNGNYSGNVRVYKFNASETSWQQLGSDIDGEAAYDNSGYSVSLSADGTTVAIGAPYNDGDGLNNSGCVSVYQLENPPITPTCFPAGTPILTDQGIVPIEKIIPTIHTINKERIVAVTQTITNEDTLVCIQKNALGNNVPSEKTIISRCHSIWYNCKMVKAKHLLNLIKNKKKINTIKYNKERLYNILMKTHNQMFVNNMIVETLDPKDIVSKLYSKNYNEITTNSIIFQINNYNNYIKNKISNNPKQFATK